MMREKRKERRTTNSACMRREHRNRRPAVNHLSEHVLDKMPAEESFIVKVPRDGKVSSPDGDFPRMSQLYLELLENATKVKQNELNREYRPAHSTNHVQPSPASQSFEQMTKGMLFSFDDETPIHEKYSLHGTSEEIQNDEDRPDNPDNPDNYNELTSRCTTAFGAARDEKDARRPLYPDAAAEEDATQNTQNTQNAAEDDDVDIKTVGSMESDGSEFVDPALSIVHALNTHALNTLNTHATRETDIPETDIPEYDDKDDEDDEARFGGFNPFDYADGHAPFKHHRRNTSENAERTGRVREAAVARIFGNSRFLDDEVSPDPDEKGVQRSPGISLTDMMDTIRKQRVPPQPQQNTIRPPHAVLHEQHRVRSRPPEREIAVDTDAPPLSSLNVQEKRIPDAARMRDESENKRRLLFRLDMIRPHAESCNISVPEFTIHSNFDNMQRAYKTVKKQLAITQSISWYRSYLIGGFIFTEYALGQWAKLDMEGFAKQQVSSMNEYEDLLVELGEKSFVEEESQWPPEVRIMFVVAKNAAFFVGTSILSKRAGGDVSTLFSMLNRANGGMKGPA